MATHTGQQARSLPFTALVQRHQGAVYGYLLRFTRDPHDAQDLFQETFFRAYRAYARAPRPRDGLDHRAWVMRIAINVSRNYARDRQRRGRVVVAGGREPAQDAALPLGNGAGMEETVAAKETTRTLLAAIEALPFRQRAALVQRQFEGLDYRTIADNLACSQDTARAHVYQALRKLRLALAPRDASTRED